MCEEKIPPNKVFGRPDRSKYFFKSWINKQDRYGVVVKIEINTFKDNQHINRQNGFAETRS